MKLLVGFLSLLLILSIYWNFFSEEKEVSTEKVVTKSNESEKKELNFGEKKVSKKLTNEENPVKKTEIVNYKDVFKEPKEMQTEVEKIVERDELKSLDEEINSLISEADGLIKEKHFTLIKQEIPEDVKSEYQLKVESLEVKLGTE